MTARFVPDPAGLRQVLSGPAGPVWSYANTLGRQIKNMAMMDCPVDTGNLRARHEFTLDAEGDTVVLQVGSTADYAIDVHEGHSTGGTVSVGGRRATVSRRVPGNPWLRRACARFGLTVN